MRTKIKHPDSKYKVHLIFYQNGWAICYFDNKEEIDYWVKVMRDAHGTITSKEIEEL